MGLSNQRFNAPGGKHFAVAGPDVCQKFDVPRRALDGGEGKALHMPAKGGREQADFLKHPFVDGSLPHHAVLAHLPFSRFKLGLHQREKPPLTAHDLRGYG